MQQIKGVLLSQREYNDLLKAKYHSEKLEGLISDLRYQIKDFKKPTNNLAELERRTIRRVLALCLGNRKDASKILGIPQRTLYRKIKENKNANAG
jgi:DNA-binding NtrC family response regulator